MTDSIATTPLGRLRGSEAAGAYAFKGIPYGASTAGENRWMPPQPLEPWTGIRDALELGPSCPQPQRRPTGWAQEMSESEDCLVLNVWTPHVGDDGAKRPVMVWLHGGGYSIGSGSWPIYDGAALAARGDVVVVTVNHRLGVLGYLYLADVPGCDIAAVNTGMLDLVASLEWVRENIACFGGDADNVTIFGESGGGAKVSALHVMPAAEGLFHRAVVQSGPGLRLQAPADATAQSLQLLASLGIEPGPRAFEALQSAAAGALVKAANDLTGGAMGALHPVLDGITTTAHPSAAFALGTAFDVPLLIGRNKDEGTLMLASDPVLGDPDSLDEDGLRARLAPVLGERSAELLDHYRAVYAGASNLDLLIALRTDSFMGIGTARLAEQKLAGSTRTPVYNYRFNWAAGPLRSAHGFEIPFVFGNVREPIMRPSPRRTLLAERMSEAWLAFARTGDPSHAGLPEWPPYSLEDRATMIFDADECAVGPDPFEEVHDLWRIEGAQAPTEVVI
ncbi:MAG: carboxylesterase/lipase family protein [Acidimicrobiales bacterium]